MSHTLNARNGETLFFRQVTIIDYTAGGETITAVEVGANGVDALFFATIPPGQNSLNAVLFPVLVSGKVMLFRFVAGVPTEIPTTVALNATVSAIIHVSIL